MGCNPSEREKETSKESISTYKQFFEAINKGAKLIVLETAVLDVSKFSSTHPGGADIFDKYLGTIQHITNTLRNGS